MSLLVELWQTQSVNKKPWSLVLNVFHTHSKCKKENMSFVDVAAIQSMTFTHVFSIWIAFYTSLEVIMESLHYGLLNINVVLLHTVQA